MTRVVTVLLILGALALAAQVATILLVVSIIAAFIIRPKETTGTLVIFGLLAAISAHPAIGFSAIAAFGVFAFYRWIKNSSNEVQEPRIASDIPLLPTPEAQAEDK